MAVYDTAVNSNAPRSPTRIENDIEMVKRFTSRIENVTERIIRHARALGYYEPTPEKAQGATPAAVTTSLADALNALDRAVDTCSGSLNGFD